MDAPRPVVWQPWARFVDRVDWQAVSASFAVVAFGVAMFMHDPLMTWLATVYTVALVGVFVTGGGTLPHPALRLGVAAVLIGLTVSTIVSDERPAHLTLLTWTAMASAFAFVKPGVLKRAALGVVVLVALHAGQTYTQGAFHDVFRASGLLFNPNNAAALLAALAIVLVARGNVWAALPFVVALPFTGSRWTTFVLVAFMAAIAVQMSWHGRVSVLAMFCIANLALVPFYGQIAAGYRVQVVSIPAVEPTAEVSIVESVKASADANVAIVEDDWQRRTGNDPGVAKGQVVNGSQHIIYLRVLNDAGLLAAAGWLGLTVLAVAAGRGGWRWAALAFAAFGAIDYYAWQIGALSVLWWATLALCIRSDQHAKDANQKPVHG